MRSLIRESIVLPAPADALYAMYLDPAKHAEITGMPVTISAETGSPFRAFNGSLSGTMLAAIPSRLVIQSWRSINFNADDPDSTLILSFVPEGKAGRIDQVHLDVPEVDYRGVSEGWEKFYWTPWRSYLGKSAGA
ncbi:MAG TPA: SRPBCC domain-containing protein [Bryobacteraceae bacterium]